MRTPAKLVVGGVIALAVGILMRLAGSGSTLVVGGWIGVAGVLVAAFGAVAWAVQVGIESAARSRDD